MTESRLRQVSYSAPGDLIVYTTDDHRIGRVVRADPVIYIADQMLYQLAFTLSENRGLGIRLDGQQPLDDRIFAMAGKHEGHNCQPQPANPGNPHRLPGQWCVCFTGCRLVLEPVEGDRVVYVIKEWDDTLTSWVAAWPD